MNRWEDKGAFGSLMDVYDVVPTPTAPGSAEIARTDVIDLTSRMKPDGTLDWDVPAGHWTVLRMGYLAHRREEPPVRARRQRLRGRQTQRGLRAPIFFPVTSIRSSSISALCSVPRRTT